VEWENAAIFPNISAKPSPFFAAPRLPCQSHPPLSWHYWAWQAASYVAVADTPLQVPHSKLWGALGSVPALQHFPQVFCLGNSIFQQIAEMPERAEVSADFFVDREKASLEKLSLRSPLRSSRLRVSI
jgi:hypothetical protein